MKVIYEFDGNEDREAIQLHNNATNFYLALSELNEKTKQWYRSTTSVNAEEIRNAFLETLEKYNLSEEDIL